MVIRIFSPLSEKVHLSLFPEEIDKLVVRSSPLYNIIIMMMMMKMKMVVMIIAPPLSSIIMVMTKMKIILMIIGMRIHETYIPVPADTLNRG